MRCCRAWMGLGGCGLEGKWFLWRAPVRGAIDGKEVVCRWGGPCKGRRGGLWNVLPGGEGGSWDRDGGDPGPEWPEVRGSALRGCGRGEKRSGSDGGEAGRRVTGSGGGLGYLWGSMYRSPGGDFGLGGGKGLVPLWFWG